MANKITDDDWSNQRTKKMYLNRFPDEPDLKRKAFDDCHQCGGCSFFAPFNLDFGLCAHPDSRHYCETVFEHFTCGDHIAECWLHSSFAMNPEIGSCCDDQLRSEIKKLSEKLMTTDASPDSQRIGRMLDGILEETKP